MFHNEKKTAHILEEAATQGTGCLYISADTGNRSGFIYFNKGKIYAAHVNGFMPKIGQRLYTGGVLDDQQYQNILNQHNHNPYAPCLGQTGVDKGYVKKDVLDAIYREVLLSSIGAMLEWSNPSVKFKKNNTTENLTIPPVSVRAINKALQKRKEHWNQIWDEIAPNMNPETTYPNAIYTEQTEISSLSSEVAAVFTASTGSLTLDQVAGHCGLTRFETGHVLCNLFNSNLLAMKPQPSQAPQPQPVYIDQTQIHGTAESATADTSNTTDMSTNVDLPKPQTNFYQPSVETDEEQFSMTDTDLGSASEYDSEDISNFAPDVIETVEAAPEQPVVPSFVEPETFTNPPESLPDGNDNQKDIKLEETVDPPYVGSPNNSDPNPYGMFVDPSALDTFTATLPSSNQETLAPSPSEDNTQLSEDSLDEGMPGVPLPPLPGFQEQKSTPPLPVLPTHAPQSTTEPEFIKNEVSEDFSISEESEEYHEPSLNTPPANSFVPQENELVTAYEEVPTTEDTFEPDEKPENNSEEKNPEITQPYEPELLAEENFTEETNTDTFNEDEDSYVEPVTQPVLSEPRVKVNKNRLEVEIGFAKNNAEIAEKAVQRANDDYAAHSESLTKHQETLDQYKNLLEQTETELQNLTDSTNTAQTEQENLKEERVRAEEQVESANVRLPLTEERLERAQEALLAAENELKDAQQENLSVQEEHKKAQTALTQTETRFTELTQKLLVDGQEKQEIEELVESYLNEITEMEQMILTLENARENATTVKEAAEHRLSSALYNLQTKQSQLEQTE